MMLKPALTDILSISCINSIQCSRLTNHAWCPCSTSALTWTMCVWGYICAKLRSNNCGAYTDRPTPPLVKENSVFQNTWLALERTELWSCAWQRLKPRMTFLARTSINLLDWTGIMTYTYWPPKDSEFESRYGQDFSRLHVVQTGPRAQSASHPVGTRGSSNGDKGIGVWSWPLISVQCRSEKCWGYTSAVPCLQGIVLNYLSTWTNLPLPFTYEGWMPFDQVSGRKNHASVAHLGYVS
jgi:hypothetical protein